MRMPFFKLIFLSFIISLMGCSDDDTLKSVDTQPQFIDLEYNISGLPGRNFTILGSIEDPAGLSYINIKYDAWFLNKTITKDSLPTFYDLSYSFKVPEDAIVGSKHVLVVSATNSGGVTTTKEVLVTLNLDVEAPEIIIKSPVDGATIIIGDQDEIFFDISVSDNLLKEFKIENDLFNETLEIEGTDYVYSKSLNIEEPGTYVFKISVTDAAGNMSEKQIEVNVVSELKFNTMYVTNVSDSSMLTSDVLGIPSKSQSSVEIGEEGYVFKAKFYADKPDTKIRFLPQKTSFEPYTFGADPKNIGALIIGSNVEVEPIILGEVGYYEVTMDLRDFTYEVVSYNPVDSPYDMVQVIATGVKVNGESGCESNIDGSFKCFHFESGKALKKDPTNPYRFTAIVELYDEPNSEANNGLILNSNTNGWAPFWRFDNAIDPDFAILGGGDAFVFSEESFGTYNFVFDTHLKQVIITPLN